MGEKMKSVFKGARFGKLTCVEVYGKSILDNDIWICMCDCGKRVLTSESMLRSGVLTSCGCKVSKAKNLQGQVFGRLTVIEPLEERGEDGSVRWICRCECGNIISISSNKLMTGHTQSCGCLGKETLGSGKTYVDGTCIEQISSEKMSINNTSGVKGVYRNRNSWCPYIAYAGKSYMLGRYDTIEEATEIRKEAEQMRIEHATALLEGKETSSFAEKVQELMRQRRQTGRILPMGAE